VTPDSASARASSHADGSDALKLVRNGDRPRMPSGTSDVEVAILEATERLLETIPFRDLSVAQIIKEAGISRASFYHYFSSKFAVITSLMAVVMAQMAEVVSVYVDRKDEVPPREALRESIINGARLWDDHRMVLRAVHEHWNAVPELREMWLRVNEGFKVGIAAEIERERASGMAPKGVPSRQLASMLVWSSGQLMFLAGLGVDEDLPSEKALIEPLASMWLGAIFGGDEA
jgi:AcrR family transcriptional regulator